MGQVGGARWALLLGGRVGWYGPVGRNVCTAPKGARVRAATVRNKECSPNSVGKKTLEKNGGVEENTHELEENAKMLERIIQSFCRQSGEFARLIAVPPTPGFLQTVIPLSTTGRGAAGQQQ